MIAVRWLLAATLLAALVVGARGAAVSESIGVTAVVAAAQSDAHAKEAPASKDAPAGQEASHGEHEGGSGWGATIAKTFNFAILVGTLVYFLRTPFAAYLTGRISKVQEDLVAVRQTRETAARQLAEIEAKLKALPLELETLKKRGAEDIVSERARIEEAANAERQRLLEATRREIEMRLRIARRELIELTADRAITVARESVAHAITPDDQARLVDRYGSQLRAQAGGGRPEVQS